MVKKAHFAPKAYICAKKFVYRLDFAPDGYADYIEDTLAQKIEPHYHQWLSKTKKRKPLESSYIADLFIFIALQRLRTPNSLRYHSDQQSLAWKEITEENLKELRDDDLARDRPWKEFEAERPEHYKMAIAQHPEWKDSLPKELAENMINEEGG